MIMTTNEIIARRDELVVEQRQVNQQLRILSNQTYQTPGIRMAIGEMRNRLVKIDEELVALANAMSRPETRTTEAVPDAIKFVTGKAYTVKEVAAVFVGMLKWLDEESKRGATHFQF